MQSSPLSDSVSRRQSVSSPDPRIYIPAAISSYHATVDSALESLRQSTLVLHQLLDTLSRAEHNYNEPTTGWPMKTTIDGEWTEDATNMLKLMIQTHKEMDLMNLSHKVRQPTDQNGVLTYCVTEYAFDEEASTSSIADSVLQSRRYGRGCGELAQELIEGRQSHQLSVDRV